jgi:hypothetical protein
MTRRTHPRTLSRTAARTAVLRAASVGLCLLVALALVSACGEDSPTGVTRESLEGVWSGDVTNVTLMGRTITGDIDWRFTHDMFDIAFHNPPIGGTERIGGSWKFSDGKVVLELRTSFPIQDDVGAKDTLFVSILGSDLSIKTLAGSDVLLTKTALADSDRGPRDTRLCKSRIPRLPRPFGLTSPANHSASPCCLVWSPGKRWKPGSSRG